MNPQNHPENRPSSSHGAATSNDTAITPEVLDGWRSELEGFFAEVRSKLGRLAEPENAHRSDPQRRSDASQAPPAHDRGKTLGPRDATPDSRGANLEVPAAASEFPALPAQPDGIEGSLERLQEIKRQLAARIGNS